MSDSSTLEVSKRWLGLIVTAAGVGGGVLSGFSSYVLQGARLSALENSFASHVIEQREKQDRRDARQQQTEDSIGTIRLESDHRLTKLEDGVTEVKGLLYHLDGRLSGVASVPKVQK